MTDQVITTVSFEVLWPPSLNRYYRHLPNRRVIISKDGRNYRLYIRRLMAQHQISYHSIPFLTGHLAFWALGFPPDRRHRDTDNYRKAMFDAFTHAGVWPDDSLVKLDHVQFQPYDKSMKPHLFITIQPFKFYCMTGGRPHDHA